MFSIECDTASCYPPQTLDFVNTNFDCLCRRQRRQFHNSFTIVVLVRTKHVHRKCLLLLASYFPFHCFSSITTLKFQQIKIIMISMIKPIANAARNSLSRIFKRLIAPRFLSATTELVSYLCQVREQASVYTAAMSASTPLSVLEWNIGRKLDAPKRTAGRRTFKLDTRRQPHVEL